MKAPIPPHIDIQYQDIDTLAPLNDLLTPTAIPSFFKVVVVAEATTGGGG